MSQDPVFWEVGQTSDGQAALRDPQLQNSYSYAANNPIVKKDPNLIAFTPGPYSTVVVGYPGKYINLPQKLERFDATAYAIGSLSENGIPACAEDEYANICGWRYSTVRRYYDFKEYYGYYTDLGIETETIKGGFSGSPVFFKGNLIGLLTHGKTREQLDIDNVGIWTEVDVADVLSSRDVVRFLEKKGFYF